MLRRLRLLLFAMALGALAAPGLVLADVGAGPWQITGLVLDGTAIPAKGKLSLGGPGLSASVGCNSIGGPYTVDGNTISIGDLTTTLVGCPGDIGKAEDALMKIFAGGPLTIGDGKWSNAAGEIDLVLIGDSGGTDGGGVTGCIPPIAPGANPGDNVTVPCGNGGSGSGGGNGSTIDPSGQVASATLDPTTLLFVIGVGVLLVATIAAFVYLGPRRTPGGESAE